MKLAALSEDARTPAPAYVLTRDSLLRIDPLGTKRIEQPLPAPLRKDWTGYATGPGGTLWVTRDDGLYALGPKELKMRLVTSSPWRSWTNRLIVRSNKDIWAFRTTEMAHYDGTSWTTWQTKQVFGSTLLPHNIVDTRDAIWVLPPGADMIWKGGSHDWAPEVPTAVGFHDKVRRIYASEQKLVGEEFHGYLVRQADWSSFPAPPSHTFDGPLWGSVLGIGPSGIVLWNRGGMSALGDADCWLDVQGVGDDGKRFTFRSATFDGSDRIWVHVQNGFRVIDRRGRVAAEYRAGMLDGLDGEPRAIYVPGGGPKSLPAPKKRRTIDIAGNLTLLGSGRALADATVTMQIGDGVVRRATTDASGAFRLTDVPEGDYEVAVAPPAGEPACPPATSRTGFEVRTAHDCPSSKVASGSCELGALSQCEQFQPQVGP